MASKDERNSLSRALTPGVQEQVHDAASETDTWAQPPWLLPGMELRKTVTREALCLQRRVSLGRRGEAGSSLKLLHQTREDHTTNLLWKLATERSPGHHRQEREKENKRAVRTDRQLPGWGSAYTSMCHLSFCTPSLCSPTRAKSGTKTFLQQRRIRNLSTQAQNL